MTVLHKTLLKELIEQGHNLSESDEGKSVVLVDGVTQVFDSINEAIDFVNESALKDGEEE